MSKQITLYYHIFAKISRAKGENHSGRGNFWAGGGKCRLRGCTKAVCGDSKAPVSRLYGRQNTGVLYSFISPKEHALKRKFRQFIFRKSRVLVVHGLRLHRLKARAAVQALRRAVRAENAEPNGALSAFAGERRYFRHKRPAKPLSLHIGVDGERVRRQRLLVRAANFPRRALAALVVRAVEDNARAQPAALGKRVKLAALKLPARAYETSHAHPRVYKLRPVKLRERDK